METVLEYCLTRVPKAKAVVCVGLDTGAILGNARAGDDDALDAEQLGRSACDLFWNPPFAEGTDDGLSEALVAGPDAALIFLRCKTRGAAVAYSIGRDNDLGMALASSRLTLPDIEAAI